MTATVRTIFADPEVAVCDRCPHPVLLHERWGCQCCGCKRPFGQVTR